jgi:glycosyltransferase involved in cell wall biosynthesis
MPSLPNTPPGTVALVAPLPPPYGGMSLQAQRLRDCLGREGVPLVVIATNPQFKTGLRFLLRIPGLRTLVREIAYLLALRRMLSRRVVVVHHLSASGLFFFLHSAPVLIAGAMCRKRVILNYRGGRALDFLRVWGRLVIPLLRLADQVVVPSVFLQRVFAGCGIKTGLLPNIAETELFSFRKRQNLFPRLLVTRNLEPMYNVECILRAFQIVQAHWPDATLGIVGTGSEEGRVRRLAEEWRLRGVTFYGAVRNPDLPAIYDAHDIYVNGSSVDNFPGALVEAACAGLPIVTTNAGGIADMLQDRQTGVLVPVNDHEALAQGVLECLRNPEFALDMARAARRWAEQFSWSNVFPRLMDCYGIAAEAPQSRPNEPVAVLEGSEAPSGREEPSWNR